MTVDERLVLKRQRHLKWRALDPLETALMVLCGLLLFGFCTTVIFDILTREIGRPWLWLQEVTSTFFIYAIFTGTAVATRRNDHLYLTAVADTLVGTARTIVEVATRLVVLAVALSLLACTLIGAMFTDVSQTAIIQKMFDGMDNEALLAIPFFLLVGELMSSANVVQRVANLSLSLVGHIRGGLSQVVTVFIMFFSEMSGSTTADVAVISRALGGPMKQEGYSPPFIAAIIAAASTIAALVPPSITAVVYGAIGNVSIAGLFMAGVVPGLMIGVGLMIFCFFFGPTGMTRPRAPFREVARAFKDASLPLMIPVILLGGILTGFFTPTEAGVVAVAWILVVVIPALRRSHIRLLPWDFCLAGLIFSLPLITIGAANAFGWLFAYLRGALAIYCVVLITITFVIFFPTVVLWLPKQVLPESVGCFRNVSGTGYICPP